VSEKNILFVNNDSKVQERVKDILSHEEDYNLVIAGTAEEADEILARGGINFVLFDVDVALDEGVNRMLEMKEKYPEIPIIFCTGQGSEEIAREAFIMGASDYFTKDFSNIAYKEKLVNSVYRAVEIKKTTREKIESEQKFLEIADLLPLMVFEIDLKGNLTYVNRFALETTGYSLEDLYKGKNVFQLVIPEDREKIGLNITRILNGEDIGRKIYCFYKKDGTTFPVSVYLIVFIQTHYR